METLGKLFGGQSRVKIMRLFLLNPSAPFDARDVTERTRSGGQAVRRDLAHLLSVGFIRRKNFYKSVKRARGGDVKRLTSGFVLNSQFEHLHALERLLVGAEFLAFPDLLKRFRGLGRIKLFVVAGIFTRDSESRLDLMIVGDALNRPQIERRIKVLESEIGKELEYAIFDTQEFKYRFDMYDKLVRDVLDFPHIRLVDGENLTERTK